MSFELTQAKRAREAAERRLRQATETFCAFPSALHYRLLTAAAEGLQDADAALSHGRILAYAGVKPSTTTNNTGA